MRNRIKQLFIFTALVLCLFSSIAHAEIDPDTAQKLLAEDGVPADLFGVPVSVSGDTAVIGAYGDDDNGSYSGSAYVFVRSGTTWVQQAKLSAPDGAADERFGQAVSISGDTVVIGAYLDDDKGYKSGSAYVFVRSGTTWNLQQKLIAPDGGVLDLFGHSVSVSGDTAIIGAPEDKIAGIWSAGSAYVFIRSGGSWNLQQKITANDCGYYNYFGESVAISGDTLLIGAYGDDDKGNYSGSAYVFVRSGTVWTKQAKLTADDGVEYDYFGYSLSISGNTALIGAYGDEDKGSAYVFARSGDSWSQQQKLTAYDGVVSDHFGWSVAVYDNTAVIGAWGDAVRDYFAYWASGSAYIFSKSNSNWNLQQKITGADTVPDDHFGSSVSISGSNVVISAPGDDDKGSSSGSVYVFNLAGSDSDGDGIADNQDNCPTVAKPDQLNTDGDAQGDACDTDDDNDTVLDSSDNCPLAVNADQANNDGDSFGDICDDDDDNDTVLDSSDNCKLTANQDQADADADGQGDACDGDQDGDGVANETDNCPAAANADQADNDGDAQGDACDADDDNDTVLDAADNCPADANADQKDLDGDNIGDVCDLDMDGDGVENADDNCELLANAAQEDTDFDGAGDACDEDDDNDGVLDAADNCSLMHNPGQENSDGDAQGDVCDGDLDGDGQANETDNCPNVANASQADFDGDRKGDACDDDVDGDGAANSGDACGFTELNTAVNPAEGCSIDQLCPCEGPRGVTGLWKNHGQHVSCTAKSAESFVGLNLITEAEKDAAVSAAAESGCGAKK